MNPQSEIRNPQLPAEDLSGADRDVWGGEPTAPVLLPGAETRCVRQDAEGRCPQGCDACRQFLEEWGQPQRTQRSAEE